MDTQSTPVHHPLDWDLRADEPSQPTPYLVELAATAQGPDGRTLRCPGFYKGAGVWCIRFAPQAEGEWTLRTTSDLPALAGRRWTVTATANPNPRVHGPLRVDPANPNHFRFADGTPCFLMGYEINWLWAIDQGSGSIERTEFLLDMIAGAGFNHVLMNSYAYDSGWTPGKSRANDFGPPALLPWAGAHGEHDYARLNPAYFDHYDRVIRAMHERGIVAHIYMKVYNKMVQWPEPRSAAEDLFFDYFVARYQAFGNIVWDFAKESYYEPDKPYIRDRLERIRRLDALKQPTTVHDDWYFMWRPACRASVDFMTDQNHDAFYMTIVDQRARGLGPILNAEYGYEWGPAGRGDVTYWVGQDPLEVLCRTYEVVMAGGYPAYYYTNHAWDVVEWGQRPAGLDGYRHLYGFFTALDWAAMQPRPELGGNLRVMTRGDDEMVLFSRAAKWRALIADEAWDGSRWTGEAMDIVTGERQAATIGPLTSGKRHPINEWVGDGHVVAHLRRI